MRLIQSKRTQYGLSYMQKAQLRKYNWDVLESIFEGVTKAEYDEFVIKRLR